MASSVGMSDWMIAQNKCIYCGESDFSSVFGPRSYIECVCCQDAGCHIDCEQGATGVEMDQETVESEQYEYFCSKVPPTSNPSAPPSTKVTNHDHAAALHTVIVASVPCRFFDQQRRI